MKIQHKSAITIMMYRYIETSIDHIHTSLEAELQYITKSICISLQLYPIVRVLLNDVVASRAVLCMLPPTRGRKREM